MLVVVAYALAHDTALVTPDFSRFSAPQPGKLFACAVSLAGLLVFDLCAWALGGVFLRLVPLSREDQAEQALLRLGGRSGDAFLRGAPARGIEASCAAGFCGAAVGSGSAGRPFPVARAAIALS
jgi:hypothetical protein